MCDRIKVKVIGEINDLYLGLSIRTLKVYFFKYAENKNGTQLNAIKEGDMVWIDDVILCDINLKQLKDAVDLAMKTYEELQ